MGLLPWADLAGLSSWVAWSPYLQFQASFPFHPSLAVSAIFFPRIPLFVISANVLTILLRFSFDFN